MNFHSTCIHKNKTIAGTRTRERVAGEIIPVSAEQSATINNDEAKHGAGRGIDMIFNTYARTKAGSDGTHWFKLKLDKQYCIQIVTWYNAYGTPIEKWTCDESDCGECENGNNICYYKLKVKTEAVAASDPAPPSDCRYGDTVRLRRKNTSDRVTVYEIVIVGKQGTVKSTTLNLMNFVCVAKQRFCFHRLPSTECPLVTSSCIG